MSQAVLVSPAGLQSLRERVASMELSLARLREEKNTAYTGSGDTWHDNPYFNKLEQDERSAARDLAELKSIVARAQVYSPQKRPIDAVRIGSIVTIERTFPGGEPVTETWEIVGYGESDRDKRQLAYNAPIGAAVIGREVGDLVEYRQGRAPDVVVYDLEVMALHLDWPVGEERSQAVG